MLAKAAKVLLCHCAACGAVNGVATFENPSPRCAMHPRLTELLSYLDAQRAGVLDAASGLPPERWCERPAPDRWSIAEVCWHLQRVEQGVAMLIRTRAAEARE